MKFAHFVRIGLILASALSLAQSPVPFLNQPLVPTSTAPGGSGFTLTVNGTGFVSGSVINWNGTGLATTFVSSSQLTATVPAANIAAAGTAGITVTSPSPGGGTSGEVFFPVSGNASLVGFSNTQKLTTGADPTSIVVGDFNADGKLDLAVANAGGNTVSVFLGNGDGTFRPRVDYATGAGPSMVSAADLRGNGNLDIVIATGSGMSVLLGNGDGTFQSHVDYPAATCSLGFNGGQDSIVAADFNADGKLDLATAVFCYEGVGGSVVGATSVFLGNGDGTFQPYIASSLVPGDTWIAAGDFDGDGVLDLTGSGPSCESSCPASADLARGNGNGTFALTSDVTDGGIENFSPIVLTADFNGDGRLDSVICNLESFSVLLGHGDGTFETRLHEGSSGCRSIAVADFHGNGFLDLAQVFLYSTTTAGVLTGDGSGGFTGLQPFPTGTNPYWVAVGDFNGDGRLDVAVANLNDNTVWIDLQSGNAQLSPSSLRFATPVTISSAAQPLTLSNAGGVDLAIGAITVSGSFTQTNNCPSGGSLHPGASCTINVTFTPTGTGNAAGTLSITNNGPTSPITATLAGVGEDFSMSSSAPNQTVSSGQVANYPVDISPIDGFNQTLNLSCSGAPAGSTCNVTPGSVVLDGSHSAITNVAVVTMRSSMSLTQPLPGPAGNQLALWLALAVLPGWVALGNIGGRSRGRQSRLLRGLAFLSLLSIGIGMSACGGGGNSSGGRTQTGTYNLTVTGSFKSGPTTLMHAAKLTLVVQ